MSARISRRVLSFSVSAALLAGCDGSQPPVGAPETMSQTSPVLSHAEGGKSWMLPEAKSEALLYLSNQDSGAVYVYSYPQRKLVGTLETPADSGAGECVDSAGNIFITTDGSSGSSEIYEYAHGGTTPIETLSDPALANGCAVDQTTGNLAVANSWDQNNPYYKYHGDLAIYADAQGNPQMYYPDTNQYDGFTFCGYDSNGNLYLSAFDEYTGNTDLIRLSRGSSGFQMISLTAKLYPYSSSLQWIGGKLMMSSEVWRKALYVYQMRVSGSSAKVLSSAELESPNDDFEGQVWFQGKTIIGLGNRDRGADAYFWLYPTGGEAEYSVKGGILKSQSLWGVTLSRGPS